MEAICSDTDRTQSYEKAINLKERKTPDVKLTQMACNPPFGAYILYAYHNVKCSIPPSNSASTGVPLGSPEKPEATKNSWIGFIFNSRSLLRGVQPPALGVLVFGRGAPACRICFPGLLLSACAAVL
jgi:hypothetical protein